MSDASFKDGRENPLRLIAQDVDDLNIISTMVQDAIAERKEMLYEPDKLSFSLLLKRFRWEDASEAKLQNRTFERVQTVLMFRSVMAVKYQGFTLRDQSLAFSLIGVNFNDNHITLSFAGNGEISVQVECVDVILSDVSQPYKAKSQNIPHHKDD